MQIIAKHLPHFGQHLMQIFVRCLPDIPQMFANWVPVTKHFNKHIANVWHNIYQTFGIFFLILEETYVRRVWQSIDKCFFSTIFDTKMFANICEKFQTFETFDIMKLIDYNEHPMLNIKTSTNLVISDYLGLLSFKLWATKLSLLDIIQ